jgi:hypothetical protein
MIGNFLNEVNSILNKYSETKIDKLLRGMQCNYFTETDAAGNDTTEDWEDCFEIEKKLNNIVMQHLYIFSNFIQEFKRNYSGFYEINEIPTIKSVSVIAVKLYQNK